MTGWLVCRSTCSPTEWNARSAAAPRACVAMHSSVRGDPAAARIRSTTSSSVRSSTPSSSQSSDGGCRRASLSSMARSSPRLVTTTASIRATSLCASACATGNALSAGLLKTSGTRILSNIIGRSVSAAPVGGIGAKIPPPPGRRSRPSHGYHRGSNRSAQPPLGIVLGASRCWPSTISCSQSARVTPVPRCRRLVRSRARLASPPAVMAGGSAHDAVGSISGRSPLVIGSRRADGEGVDRSFSAWPPLA